MRYLANSLEACASLAFCYFKPSMWFIPLIVLLFTWQFKGE